MLLQSVLFITGMCGVYFGAEWLVKGSSKLSREFGIKPIIIGLTVVAFGTSSPELVVSLIASIKEGSDEIAIGNIIGSNIANIGLVLGISAMVFPLKVDRIIIKSELPFMIAISAVLYLMAIDKKIGFFDGLFLFTGIILYTGYRIYSSMNSKTMARNLCNTNKESSVPHEYSSLSESSSTQPSCQPADLDAVVSKEKTGIIRTADKQSSIRRKNLLSNIFYIVTGLICLLIGAHLLVKAAIFIAGKFGISQMVIGLTVVAVGTTIPEMATSVVCAFRKEVDICVGNVIGSNIFNILMVIGSVALIKPLNVAKKTIFFEFPVMLLFAIALIPMIMGNLKINRIEGFLLTLGYFIFVILLFR